MCIDYEVITSGRSLNSSSQFEIFVARSRFIRLVPEEECDQHDVSLANVNLSDENYCYKFPQILVKTRLLHWSRGERV